MPDEHNPKRKRIPPARRAKGQSPKAKSGEGTWGLGFSVTSGIRV